VYFPPPALIASPYVDCLWNRFPALSLAWSIAAICQSKKARMGPHFKIVNLDKKEYLNPADFADGRKLLGFRYDVAEILVLLVSRSDAGPPYLSLLEIGEIWGHWAGDRIIIVCENDPSGLYDQARHPDYRRIVDVFHDSFTLTQNGDTQNSSEEGDDPFEE
jgi:hypothetical protein